MTERKTYTNINLVCKTCGKEFMYTTTEQKFFEEKGFSAPIRCHECRSAKKARNVERDKKMAVETKPYTINAEEDWVSAMNERWNEQVVLFKDKD